MSNKGPVLALISGSAQSGFAPS